MSDTEKLPRVIAKLYLKFGKVLAITESKKLVISAQALLSAINAAKEKKSNSAYSDQFDELIASIQDFIKLSLITQSTLPSQIESLRKLAESGEANEVRDADNSSLKVSHNVHATFGNTSRTVHPQLSDRQDFSSSTSLSPQMSGTS